LFNGASSGIFSLFRLLKTRECYIYSPAYLEYKRAGLLFNYKINLINRFNNLNSKIKKDSLIIFVNPSTPDGKYYDLDKLLQKWIAKNCTILIDESFLEFTSEESTIKYLKEYKKLYILKSMTKFYSSAGVRFGAIISNKKNIKELKRFEPMWKISQFDKNYIETVIKDKKFIQKSKKINNRNRNLLIEVLSKNRFVLKIYNSSANYILIKLKDINSSQFQELLKPSKIMVRDCYNFDFLDNNYIRIAVKNRKSIQLLEKVYFKN
jgi:threonine-phosphate decarboxylase